MMSTSFWSRLWPKKKTSSQNCPYEVPLTQDQVAIDLIKDWSDHENKARQSLKDNQPIEALTILLEIPVGVRQIKTWGLIAEAYALRHDWTAFNACADEAIGYVDDPATMQTLLGEICFEYKNIDAALDWLQVAVELNVNQPRAWLRLGDIYSKRNDEKSALPCYQQAYELASEDLKVTCAFQLGQTLQVLHRFEEARAAYKDVLVRDPRHVFTWTALGHIDLLEDFAESALICYENAYKSTSHPSDHLRMHYGIALRFIGNWNAALEQFHIAWENQPQHLMAQWYYCQSLLALEQWKKGWPLYQRGRFADTPPRPMPFPTWEGQPIVGKTLLLLAEQGLGDEIMFASCVPDVIKHSQATQIFIECDSRLVPLFQRSFFQTTPIASDRRKDGSWLPNNLHIDYQCFTGDLPALYRMRTDQFPQHQGYLNVDQTLQTHWKRRLLERAKGRLKVGLSWRGGLLSTRQRIRSLSAIQLAPLLSIPDVYFISLQYGEVEEDLAKFRALNGVEIDHFPELIPDYDATAAMLTSLDLVITVCTSLVHLSGAVHVPAWVMTPFSPEWRYTAHESRMLWYPSVRLYRQPKLDDWTSVCQKVVHDLTCMTKNVTGCDSNSFKQTS